MAPGGLVQSGHRWPSATFAALVVGGQWCPVQRSISGVPCCFLVAHFARQFSKITKHQKDTE
eukprot:7172250-Karenia_brevis.AAC.1